MVEILGVVASGIAVTQLADKFVRSMNNMHTFWRDVKDAPQSIGNILEELEILGLILRKNLGQHCSPQGEDSAILRCLEYCKKTSEGLESIVAKLKLDADVTASRKRWNNVKGAFKKGEIQDVQSRLDRAKEMLNLAISTCSLSMQSELKHSIVLLQVNQSANEKLKAPAETHQFLIPNTNIPTTHLQRARKSTNTYKPWWFPGYLQCETAASPTTWQENDKKPNEKCNRATQWRLVAVSWLHPKHLSFEFCGNNWKYSFKLARTVPSGSEVFKVCEDGDVQRMIELFNSGLATINDVLPNGETLLHKAARRRQAYMCDWLITQGVDCTAVDDIGCTPLHTVTEGPQDFKAILKCARLLVERGQIDPLLQCHGGWTCFDWQDAHTSLFEYLIYSQERFSVDYSQISNESLLQVLGVSGNVYAPRIIRQLIGSRGMSSDIATEVWFSESLHRPVTFLYGAVYRLSLQVDLYGLAVQELEYILKLIKCGADIHFQTSNELTLWDRLLDARYVNFETNKECLILSWLSCLHKSGVNIAGYLRKEEEIHDRGQVKPVQYHRKSINRVFTVYYGERDDDVTVLVEDTWNEKEHSSCPGAWDEEMEDAEACGMTVLYDQEPTAFWSFTTSGFQDGDYSAVRAGCDPELPKRQRRDDHNDWTFPDLDDWIY
ncbi:hypothetical protein HYFRA_00007427 [Hymenoscyphus fraxineus]|uniref:Fungal N-terminal domain-containing protein n=1 Tax=Hymenoscyphus fraxineus TaxID=746836 RepID=A0A9N9KQZ1_9HELO|nr:hypothetical protein HYFRA_00007427 [Hymenoscyphus fraxineus]